MALKKSLQINTAKTGEDIISEAYFNIPRGREYDFYIDEDYITFYVYAWKDIDTKAENGKEPLKKFQVRIYDTPRDNPIKDGENVVHLPYTGTIDIPTLNSFIASHIGQGKTLFDVYKKAIVDQFYPILKLQTNFCGEDMTFAIDC